jgi:hypothetical protein
MQKVSSYRDNEANDDKIESVERERRTIAQDEMAEPQRIQGPENV